MTEQKDNIPVIRISLQIGIGEARALSFETYTPITASEIFICALLDKLNFCADRSKAVYEIEELERAYAQEARLLEAMRENLELIDNKVAARRATSGKRGENPPTANEEKSRADCVIQIKERGERLKKLREEIETKTALVKAGDINGNSASPTNS